MKRARSNSRSRTKFAFYVFIYIIFLIIAFYLLAELVLRERGFQSWKVQDINIKVEPGGKFFTKHHLLGYTHLPGRFKVTLEDIYSFNVTHLANTLRITHPLDSYHAQTAKPEIWLFGGSITHGWGLNDEETFPWLLQEKLSRYEVVNFGTSGYGTLQSLIQFKEAIKKKRPQLVVVIYSSMHNERNASLRIKQKNIAPWNHLGPLVQPYARLGRTGRLRYSMSKVEYSEFPLMRYSALIHWIEQRYNRAEDLFYNSYAITKAIIKEFSVLCKQHNIKLIVAGITHNRGTYNMLKDCAREGMLVTDISVDLRDKKNILWPTEGHPNAIANRTYASKLYTALEHILVNDK